ncbi:unnamed protein product [Cyprideis torosa]|uniref:Uncharacterized protein n=1 Tax=Cyprideis torosa TaxID=163714 RepID=A0A7R8ZI57_9CRUS|nr:unnamed protein product [Cyprideis torosa]CAG0885308.1 unnamed protein product [Cyprideis torosa]
MKFFYVLLALMVLVASLTMANAQGGRGGHGRSVLAASWASLTTAALSRNVVVVRPKRPSSSRISILAWGMPDARSLSHSTKYDNWAYGGPANPYGVNSRVLL